MEITGHIENGVVVLDPGVSLPEGTAVTVVVPATPEARGWDAFFAEKLVINSNAGVSDEIEISKDDLLF